LRKKRSAASALRVGLSMIVQRGTRRIDSALEVMPRLVDLDVRLIHAGRIVGRTPRRSTAFVQLWRIALDPSEYRGVVDPPTAFPQKRFHVAVAQRVAQIPPHGAEDGVGVKMAPCE
jgi:hypothetical protein